MAMIALNSVVCIDLGTATTRVSISPQYKSTEDDTVVATVSMKNKQHISIGKDARIILTSKASAVPRYPLLAGRIHDDEAIDILISTMLEELEVRIVPISRIAGYVTIAASSTQVEKSALKRAARSCGISPVVLVPQPLAAAVGAGLEVEGTRPSVCMNCGYGVFEIALIGFGEVLLAKRLYSSGENLVYRLGRGTKSTNATTRKKTSSTAVLQSPTESEQAMLSVWIQEVVEEVAMALDMFGSSLSTSLVDQGVLMTGGFALTAGLSTALSQALKIPFFIAPKPEQVALAGLVAMSQAKGKMVS